MEFRSLTNTAVDYRQEKGTLRISGYAAVFNTLSEDLGGYREKINRRAFDRTLREINEGKRVVSARIQHMGGLTTVGTTANGSLKLSTDAKGLKYEIVALPNTCAGRDIAELVEGGYIFKSSFAFILPELEGAVMWNWSTTPPTRTVFNCDLIDVAPVDGPAYLDTSVVARSGGYQALTNAATRTRVETRQAQGGGTIAELYILDQIVPTWLSRSMTDATSSGKVIEALAAVPDAKRIDVFINSPGGDVFEGTAIYNTLKDHPAPVHVHVQGLAASIASLIAMAGDTVTMGDGAFMMVHNAWTATAGNAKELRTDANRLDKIDETLVDIYAKRSKTDAKSAKRLMDKETWLTADEAVKAGLADRVSGKADIEGDMAQRCREMNYRNVPPALGIRRGRVNTRGAA